MFPNNRNFESGRSLVEIVGVMAIMTLISAAAFVLIKTGMSSQRRNIIVDDISNISSGVRTLYADYDDLSVLTDSDGTLAAIGVGKNGPIDGVTYSVTKTADNSGFVVTVSGLPNKDCVVLGTRGWPDSVSHTECNNGTITITYKK